jgi:hypothetical protein
MPAVANSSFSLIAMVTHSHALNAHNSKDMHRKFKTIMQLATATPKCKWPARVADLPSLSAADSSQHSLPIYSCWLLTPCAAYTADMQHICWCVLLCCALLS